MTSSKVVLNHFSPLRDKFFSFSTNLIHSNPGKMRCLQWEVSNFDVLYRCHKCLQQMKNEYSLVRTRLKSMFQVMLRTKLKSMFQKRFSFFPNMFYPNSIVYSKNWFSNWSTAAWTTDLDRWRLNSYVIVASKRLIISCTEKQGSKIGILALFGHHNIALLLVL